MLTVLSKTGIISVERRSVDQLLSRAERLKQDV